MDAQRFDSLKLEFAELVARNKELREWSRQISAELSLTREILRKNAADVTTLVTDTVQKTRI